MPKSRAQKAHILKDLGTKVGEAKSIIFAKISGLGVKDNEVLRKQLRAEKSEFVVAKKTLIDLALGGKVENFDSKKLEGQIAAIFSFEDEVIPAKVLAKFKKGFEGKIDFAGGVLDNKFITADKAMELANLPSKQELYAKLVGSINAPVSGFVNALAGNLRNLVHVLKAIEEKK